MENVKNIVKHLLTEQPNPAYFNADEFVPQTLERIMEVDDYLDEVLDTIEPDIDLPEILKKHLERNI